MKTRTGLLAVSVLQLCLLAGCGPAILGPSVMATPGPGKTQADFAADQAACSAQANQQLAPAKAASSNQVVNTLLTTDLGTAAATAQQNNASLQQQFDAAYSGCMSASGETVPGYVVEDAPVRDRPYRPRKAAPTPAGSAGFVEPAPAAPANSGGFTEPPASGGFAEPPAAK